uniref:C-type LECtin n=1 Tax=Parastrongyloides trichosuri TaxID=131310 RepID=A0A0N4ZTE6_PARTI
MLTKILILFIIFFVKEVYFQEVSCPTSSWKYDPSMNACYYPSKNYYSFATAKKSCQSMNATLSYVKSFIEDEVIKTIVEYTSEHEEFWLGGQKMTSDNKYYWLDGTPITNSHFDNWMIGYPQNTSGSCVAMKVDNLLINGFINDNCLTNKRYICAIYDYASLPTEETKSCPPQNYNASVPGTIISPGYPSDYPSNSDCIYSIQAPVGRTIQLTINFFQTEECCDWLYIHDGKNSNANKIASLRGSVPSGTQYISSGNSFYIRFTSDQNNNDKGFNIGYQMI